MKNRVILLSVIFLFLFAPVFSQSETGIAKTIIEKTSLSGEWYLGFNYNDDKNISQFNLKRGYFTLKTDLNDILSVRYTQDITVDKEGGDAGNVEIRLKYLYLKLDLKKIDPLKDTYFEFGLVHRPWIDYEQKMNGYRVQGAMYSDRYDLTTSADFGILYSGLIGGKIETDKHKYLGSSYPGKYGSFAIGIFNGGGYHAIEKNSNKVFEGRLTLRPFPETLPGIQASYAAAFGKANTQWGNSDYNMNLFFLSIESRYIKVTGQYYKGIGGYAGDYIDEFGSSYMNNGFSLFGEISIPGTSLSLFSRYDRLYSHQDELIDKETIIGGITYRFLKNKVLIDYDQLSVDGSQVRVYELALEINF